MTHVGGYTNRDLSMDNPQIDYQPGTQRIHLDVTHQRK
jgi:hypothetical protein